VGNGGLAAGILERETGLRKGREKAPKQRNSVVSAKNAIFSISPLIAADVR
jgi:hypothetical protein